MTTEKHTMYIGQYFHTIDSKSRIFLPARYRTKNASFILTRGLENCLYLYDSEGWEKVLAKLDDLSLSDKIQQRAFKRMLLSGAHESKPDFQGRILVPQALRDHARIATDVIIIGVGNRLELWDKILWEKYYEQHADVTLRTLAGQLEI